MPADPAAVPPPVPEWMAKALGYESAADFDECYLANTYYEAPKRDLVRLLMSVREDAIRQAADTVCALPVPLAFAQHGIMGVDRMTAAAAILALLHTPQSGGGA